MIAFRAVVFDLDDTLYPEKQYVQSGFRVVADWIETMSRLAAEDTYEKLLGFHERGFRGDVFDRWVIASGRTELEVSSMVEMYRTHQPTLSLFDGVRDLLQDLRSHVSLGLLSDGFLLPQEQKLSALNIGHLFDSVVFSDSLGRDSWKPNWRPYQIVLEELQVAAREVVYVADNPCKDFVGARGLGMATIWARHSNGDYARLDPPGPEYAADETTDSISALRAQLVQNLGIHE